MRKSFFNRYVLLLLLAASFAFAGCSGGGSGLTGDTSSVSSVSSKGNITVYSGGSSIVPKNLPVTLTSETGAPGLNRAAAKFDYDITYVARAMPVMVEGRAVQANDIIIRGSKAYISYNVAGETFAGAIQVVDISNKDNPSVLNEIQFKDADINCLFLDEQGNRLLFGVSANPDTWGFATPAAVGMIKLSAINAEEVYSSIKHLPSYAATGVAKKGNNYYVGVGAKDGGISVLDESLYEVGFMSYPDVRDIVSYKDGLAALAGNTDSTREAGLLVFSDQYSVFSPISIPGFSAYHKATVGMYNSNGKIFGDEDAIAFLGLSELGMKVLKLKGGAAETVYELANPAGANYNTNSVSYDNNSETNDNSQVKDNGLAFVANGEYGFRVLKLNIKSKDSDPFAEITGFHKLDGSIYDNRVFSVNHIEYKAGYLVAACGENGVNIYRVDKK